MRGPKRTADGSQLRILTFALVLSMVIMAVVILEPVEAQVAPRYNDPEITVVFSQSGYRSRFENNAHVADVSGTIHCDIDNGAPDGIKVRVNIHLRDEYDYRDLDHFEFQKGGATNQEFYFKYFISGEFLAGVGIILTLSSDWEYLSPEEGGGDIAPVTAGVTIGPYCIIGVERVKPMDSIKLESGKWKTIELNILNLGNTETTVFIDIYENPANIDVDIFRGVVIVGPFNEFPFTFTIRYFENRDIDSYITLKARTKVDGEDVISYHRIDIYMEKEDVRIDIGSGAMLALVPSIVILFFIVMLVFWARLAWMKRKRKKELK